MIEIVLPWPPKELSPNSRLHLAMKKVAVANYREVCRVLTIQSKVKIDWPGDVHAWIDFIPPDRRLRDDDNAFASFKAGRDGICDALGINDNRIRSHPWLKAGEIGSMVKVRLTQGPSRA